MRLVCPHDVHIVSAYSSKAAAVLIPLRCFETYLAFEVCIARIGLPELFPHQTEARICVAAHLPGASAQQHPELERSATPADQRLATRMKL